MKDIADAMIKGSRMSLIYSIILFGITLFPILRDGICYSSTLEYIHIAMSFICSIALFSNQNKPYSLYKVFHLFFLFFFCIAPILQYKNQVILLDTLFVEREYIKTSVVLLLVLILFNVGYFVSYKQIKIHRRKSRKIDQTIENKRTIYLLLIISIAICVFNFYLNNFNIMSLLVREDVFKSRVEMNQIADLVIDKLLRPMPMILFLSSLIYKTERWVKCLFAISFFLTTPFTGMPRNAAAAMYIPVLLWCVPFFQRKNVFILTLTLGLLVVFPFLNNFRVLTSINDISFDLNFDQFEDLNFDSYSMFMRVISGNVITNGYQFLGVLLFWVPRSLWTSKPMGSGFYVAETTHLSFNNISMPYFGEGYINWGYLGVVLFAIVLAYVLAKLDKKYWTYTHYQGKTINKIKYFMLLGLLMFILRGDLLSSFAYTIGYMVSFEITKRIVQGKQ